MTINYFLEKFCIIDNFVCHLLFENAQLQPVGYLFVTMVTVSIEFFGHLQAAVNYLLTDLQIFIVYVLPPGVAN